MVASSPRASHFGPWRLDLQGPWYTYFSGCSGKCRRLSAECQVSLTERSRSVWNLFHIALRRHRFGRGLRKLPRIPFRSRSRRTPPPETSRVPRSPTWRRWIRVGDHDPRAGPNDVEINAQSTAGHTMVAPSPPISLRERPVEMKRNDSFTATSRTASSHSGSKSDERGLTRAEREKEKEMEIERQLQGGLSPPPPLKI